MYLADSVGKVGELGGGRLILAQLREGSVGAIEGENLLPVLVLCGCGFDFVVSGGRE